MPQDLHCHGFEENLVLEVKSQFDESDMRQVLILRLANRSACYHNRHCSSLWNFEDEGELVDNRSAFVSSECRNWFNDLFSVSKLVNRGTSFTEDHDFISNKIEEDIFESNDAPANIVDVPKERKNLTVKRKPPTRVRKRRKSVDRTEIAPDQIKGSVGGLKCMICEKEFPNNLRLTRHVKRSHNTKRNPCDLCGQMVKDLQSHVRLQHSEKDMLRYFCEFCGRGFKSFSSYSFHHAGHSGEKNYRCSACSKAHRCSSAARKCERGHADKFKYRCTSCPYRTQQKNKMDRHLRTHTKLLPFTCPLCHRKFARKDYLQKHIGGRTHAGTSLFEVESKYPNLYSTAAENVISNQPVDKSEEDAARAKLEISEAKESSKLCIVTSSYSVDAEAPVLSKDDGKSPS